MKLGFGRAEITPTGPVALTGYGNEAMRYWKNILDPLYATCLAFTDETGETALIYTLDLLYPADRMRAEVSRAVGLPVEKIQFSAIHTHGAPDWREDRGLPETTAYLDGDQKRGLIAAAKEALADRKEATAQIAVVQTEHMNFVRHYRMVDGTYSGPNFGTFRIPIAGYESEADHSMQLVKFVRQGGPDVIAANFQAHQTMTGGMRKYDVSADFSGAMRASLEARTGCRLAYFTGASGNITPDSMIKQDNRFTEEQYKEYGQALADYVIGVEDGWRPAALDRVRTEYRPLQIDVDHRLDPLEGIAREIVKEWKATGNREKCTEMCRAHGLNSVYHAESVLDKLALGKTLGIELNAVSLGDVAFCMVPYEMFDTNGMALKADSPYPMTVVATCANNVRSYIPSALGFEHGGYSVDRCRFVPGTGERLEREFVQMLEKLYHT